MTVVTALLHITIPSIDTYKPQSYLIIPNKLTHQDYHLWHCVHDGNKTFVGILGRFWPWVNNCPPSWTGKHCESAISNESYLLESFMLFVIFSHFFRFRTKHRNLVHLGINLYEFYLLSSTVRLEFKSGVFFSLYLCGMMGVSLIFNNGSNGISALLLSMKVLLDERLQCLKQLVIEILVVSLTGIDWVGSLIGVVAGILLRKCLARDLIHVTN